MSDVPEVRSKRRRVTKACDFCHRRGRKCRPSDGNASQCSTCIDHGVDCTWTRVAAKRGVKPRAQHSPNMQWTLDEQRHGSHTWLQALVNVFFNDVYPIICTIHEASFRLQWSTDNMRRGRASYARVLAMCALSAQRIATGASARPDHVEIVSAQIYIDDAISAISGQLQELRDLESLQAVHLLCVAAMEIGYAPLFHQLMGLYHAMVADQGLLVEQRWPQDISTIELEERRRLIWHMYRLEVHTALILGHVVRLPEIQIAVGYPEDPNFDVDMDYGASSEWLTGWNFVTDLYRGLEHVLVQFRSRKCLAHPTGRIGLFNSSRLSDEDKSVLLDRLKTKYEQLPHRFHEPSEMSADIGRNRCVYQIANIICTYQLLKMLSYASGSVTFHDACQTVLDLVEGISAIPVEFLRAMSLAMVQELSGFGHLLGSFIGKDMSLSDYERLRTVMSCMTELLECLTSSIPAAHDATAKLVKYVNEIEERLLQVRTASTIVDQGNHDLEAAHMTNAEMMFSGDAFENTAWLEMFTQGLDQQ